ncbi:MAG: hypothetical protein ACTHKR_00485 [Sphingomonas sp.]
MEQHAYIVGAADELGDQHILMTGDSKRALAAYHRLKAQYGNVRMNDAVADTVPASHLDASSFCELGGRPRDHKI